jgi:hypothetical protein
MQGYSNQTRVSKFQKNVIRSALNDFYSNHDNYETSKVNNNNANGNDFYYQGKGKGKGQHTMTYDLDKVINELKQKINCTNEDIEKIQQNITIIEKNINNGIVNLVDNRNLKIFKSKLSTLQSTLDNFNIQLKEKLNDKKIIDYEPINVDKLQFQISAKKTQLYTIKNKEKRKKKLNENELKEKQQLVNNIEELTKNINDAILANKIGKLNKKYYYTLLDDVKKFKETFNLKDKYNDNELLYIFCNNYNSLVENEYYFYVKNNSKFLELKVIYDTSNISKVNIGKKKEKVRQITQLCFENDDEEW